MTDKNTTETPDTPDATSGEPAGWPKMLIEFGPLLVFFAGFKFGDIWVATATFMAASLAAMIASKILFKKIAAMLKVTFAIVMVMGGLTLYLQDETFVKMKLTIINGIFASILLVGLLRGKLYLKMVMGAALPLDNDGWRIFSRHYVLFLLVMAVVNEAIWRTQTTDFWVNFKTFGYMGAMFLFLMLEIGTLTKHMPDKMDEK